MVTFTIKRNRMGRNLEGRWDWLSSSNPFGTEKVNSEKGLTSDGNQMQNMIGWIRGSEIKGEKWEAGAICWPMAVTFERNRKPR